MRSACPTCRSAPSLPVLCACLSCSLEHVSLAFPAMAALHLRSPLVAPVPPAFMHLFCLLPQACLAPLPPLPSQCSSSMTKTCIASLPTPVPSLSASTLITTPPTYTEILSSILQTIGQDCNPVLSTTTLPYTALLHDMPTALAKPAPIPRPSYQRRYASNDHLTRLTGISSSLSIVLCTLLTLIHMHCPSLSFLNNICPRPISGPEMQLRFSARLSDPHSDWSMDQHFSS